MPGCGGRSFLNNDKPVTVTWPARGSATRGLSNQSHDILLASTHAGGITATKPAASRFGVHVLLRCSTLGAGIHLPPGTTAAHATERTSAIYGRAEALAGTLSPG